MIDWDYILRRAWRITWAHKALWLFGFLVSLGTVGTRLWLGRGPWEQLAQGLPVETQRALADLLSSPLFLIALPVVGFLASVGLVLLNALGRAALVHQVHAAEQFGMVVLKGGWLAGREHLWRVFAIRLLLVLPLAVLLLVGMLPPIVAQVVAARQERIEVVIPAVLAMQVLLVGCLVPALCLVALLSIPLRILQRLAVRACVLESLNVRQSIRRGWQIAREHPGPLTLVWLILLGTGIAVAVLASLPLVLIGVPLMTIILLVALASPVGFAALTLTAGLLLWLLAAACGSVVETFASTLWTLAYRELHGMGLTGEEGHFASTHR